MKATILDTHGGSFFTQRSQKYKMTEDLTIFFTLLGSTCVKALRITLIKLTPGINPKK